MGTIGTKAAAVFGLVLIVVSFPMYFWMLWDALFLIPALIPALTGTILAVLGALGIRDGGRDNGHHI